MLRVSSRHNGVHLFDISTSKTAPTLVCFVRFCTDMTSKCASRYTASKSVPRMVCFVCFDFEMCFAPQRRALFDISTSKVLREWCVLYILTSKCASCHNGVQFFISDLARWLRTRRFSKPTFRPSGATNHWKTEWFATCLPFRAPASSFFGLFLFSDLLAASLLFSDSSHLCFVTCPYSRKFDF